MDPQTTDTSKPKDLSALMTKKQIDQLAGILERVMIEGYGSVEIEVVKGHVRFFKPKISIAAVWNGDE